MKIKYVSVILLGFICIVFVPQVISGQGAEKPKYKADVPEGLMTPDKVQTEF